MPNWLLDYRQRQARRSLVEATDWPRKCAELEVKLAFALGFLRTIPGEDVDPEEAESWYQRLDRFLTMDVPHNDGEA